MKKLLFFATPLSNRTVDVAYFLFRLHIGLSMAIGAGWSKLTNVTAVNEVDKLGASHFSILSPDWFVQQVSELGFTYPSPHVWAFLATWGEFMGGLLIAIGLLTRLGAFQLAFQFFVLAFIWYSEPEFILGMYYQQLLFWGYVLVTALGGGRFSVDYWLTRQAHKPINPIPAIDKSTPAT